MTHETDVAYCQAKFGSCSCAKVGRTVCESISKLNTERLLSEAREEKAQREQAKRARYITDEDPRHIFTKLSRDDFTYYGLWDLSYVDRYVRKMLEKKLEPVSVRYIDHHESMKRPYHTSRGVDRELLKTLRTGSIPKDKLKPYHALLEDPVKRKKK